MTELYLNGYLCVLPENIEFSIVEDNPFLTKSGEYSFDVEMDLRNEINAKIFRHLHRFNQQDPIDTLPAILIADNQVRLRGSAAVLGKTDTSVKIQLLSGNSELNYLIGADRKIIELDLGRAATPPYNWITEEDAIASLHKKYPESDYVCAPVMTSGCILNRYERSYNPDEERLYDIVPMPYLTAYVRKMLEALGYHLIENQLLEEEKWRRTYIVHGKKTFQYNEILGGWTIQDFFVEIEKFCNVVLVIDKESLSVRILKNYNRGQQIQTVFIDQVLDQYQTDYEKDNEIESIDYDAVRYDLPQENPYNYKSLSQEVLENAEIEEYETFQDLKTALGNDLSPYYNNKKIYRVRNYSTPIASIESGNYYVVDQLASRYILQRAHEFRPAGDLSKNVIELKIVPAKMDACNVDFYGLGPDGIQIIGNGFLQLPSVASEKTTDAEDDELGVIDWIEGNGNRKNAPNEAETIPAAIYFGFDYALDADGKAGGDVGNTPAYAPWSQTDCWVESFSVYSEKYHLPYFYFFDIVNRWDTLLEEEKQKEIEKMKAYQKLTLRLDSSYGLFQTDYAKNEKLSSRETWTMAFIPNQKISPQNTFVIRNKKFLCISLETKFNHQGALPLVEGKFYPLE